jgi:transcriptional regulator with XRE-family HTH domain
MHISAEKLRELREERAYSLRGLARVSGVAYNTVLRIEHGQEEVWPRTVRRLAEALGVEPMVLQGSKMPEDG